jgi:hypothetical protein
MTANKTATLLVLNFISESFEFVVQGLFLERLRSHHFREYHFVETNSKYAAALENTGWQRYFRNDFNASPSR